MARKVGTDPNIWASTAMKDAPSHVREVVVAVMNTSFRVDAVQRQLLDEAARAIQELSKLMTEHRSPEGLVGSRGTRIEALAVHRRELLDDLDMLMSVYRDVAAEPKPPAKPAKAFGLLNPADTPPKARTPRR